MFTRRIALAAAAIFISTGQQATAVERQWGPVNVELQVGAGAQAGSYEDPQTGLSGDDSDFTWSA